MVKLFGDQIKNNERRVFSSKENKKFSESNDENENYYYRLL